MIIRSALRDNVKLIIAESADDYGYLKYMNAKALYMSGEESSILISPNASRAEILEEAIHHQQFKSYGESYFNSHRLELEIEAQKKLIRIGQKEGWAKADIDEIRQAQKHYESELKEHK